MRRRLRRAIRGMNWMSTAAVAGSAFAITVVGTRVFQVFAIRAGIVANPNFRSLHQRPMPRAGGIVFALVFLLTITLWNSVAPDAELMRAIAVGGAIAAIFGCLDDVVNIGALTKLLVQAALAGWLLAAFRGAPIIDLPLTPWWVDLAGSWFLLVWLLNLYNFMDGIDGMAASGAVFICGAASIALLLSGHADAVPTLLVLGACALGFLLFNWPPATIFMGDAGSLFLGYCFGALMVATIAREQMTIWTWLVIFGYFGGDTTTTTVTRIFITNQWYGEHRSHAYQNLARLGGHLGVVRGVMAYHVCWLLPLAIWSVWQPATAPLAAVLALAPVVGWTLRYGPPLSSS